MPEDFEVNEKLADSSSVVEGHHNEIVRKKSLGKLLQNKKAKKPDWVWIVVFALLILLLGFSLWLLGAAYCYESQSVIGCWIATWVDKIIIYLFG